MTTGRINQISKAKAPAGVNQPVDSELHPSGPSDTWLPSGTTAVPQSLCTLGQGMQSPWGAYDPMRRPSENRPFSRERVSPYSIRTTEAGILQDRTEKVTAGFEPAILTV